jgi:hypothetical protein
MYHMSSQGMSSARTWNTCDISQELVLYSTRLVSLHQHTNPKCKVAYRRTRLRLSCQCRRRPLTLRSLTGGGGVVVTRLGSIVVIVRQFSSYAQTTPPPPDATPILYSHSTGDEMMAI